MADLQYYDGKFTTEQGNMVYHNLINVIPKKPPYFNDSFRTLFVQGAKDKGDKQQYFVTKRKGFTRVKTYERDQTTETTQKRYFRDRQVLDGYVYFFAVNFETNECRIYKQININNDACATNVNFSDITEGNIVNITDYNGSPSFPWNKCLYDKFVRTSHVKGEMKDSGVKGVARTNLVDKTYFCCLYNEDGTPINANAGDYIYITKGRGIEGYVVPVAGLAGSLPTGEMSLDPNALMIAGNWVPGMNMTDDMGNVLTDVTTMNIEYKIFPSYGLTLNFISEAGVINMHYDAGSHTTFEWSIVPNTDILEIAGFSTFNNSTAILDKSGSLYIGGQGWNKFEYSALRLVPTNGLYQRIEEHMGYLLLLGKDNMAYYTYDPATNIGRTVNITNFNGIFGVNSYKIIDDKFFLIRNTNDFYEMGINVGYSGALPTWFFTYMNNYLNTDLGMLDRTVDEVDFEVGDNQFQIFMTNNSGNTKVLLYDRYYELWYKWYITGCEITRVMEGVYLGNGIFINEGITDDGHDITEIINMVFGDQTHSSNKKIEFVKTPIGYNSYIEHGKSFFVSYCTDGGWHYKTTYGNLGRMDYVNNLMKLKINATTDNPTENIVTDYPIGLELVGAKGMLAERAPATNYEEFEEYLNYTNTLHEIELGDEETEFNIAKMGLLKFPLGQWGEVFTFELVALKDNVIEFGGFFIGFQYSDIDVNRLENTATFGEQHLTDDSYGKLTVDSGYTLQVNPNDSDTLLNIIP